MKGFIQQREVKEGQYSGRSGRQKMKLANRHFKDASAYFATARSYYDGARRYIDAVYKDEVLIIDFYEAEVDFYARHTSQLLGDEADRNRSYREQLEAVRLKFDDIMSRADARVVDDIIQPHQRLLAHCNYYLGKVERRLAAVMPHGDERSQRFDKAFTYFEHAMRRARHYQDRVLIARIEFALGQWYESQIDRERNALEDQQRLEQARSYVLSAYEALVKWEAELERDDVKAFFDKRLSLDK